MTADQVAPEHLEKEDEAWDAFVAAGPGTTHLQTTAWANVKRSNGWSPLRAVTSLGDATVGGQILTRRASPMPWRMGYVPRGPIGATLAPGNVAQVTALLRDRCKSNGIAYLVFEPEVPASDELEAALRKAGWRRTTRVQPDASRLIDLTPPVDELWQNLRSKWRQYVTKARRGGILVSVADGSRLDDFYSVYSDAYRRAGVTFRNDESFSVLWNEMAPKGMAHLFMADSADGKPVATLLLLSTGRRVAEIYGGSTEEGNESRANYLIKWAAIEHFRELGFSEYDMYGIPHSGIAHFKAGFGGEEVKYVGAWETAVSPAGRIVALANSMRARYVKLRHGRWATRGR